MPPINHTTRVEQLDFSSESSPLKMFENCDCGDVAAAVCVVDVCITEHGPPRGVCVGEYGPGK